MMALICLLDIGYLELRNTKAFGIRVNKKGVRKEIRTLYIPYS